MAAGVVVLAVLLALSATVASLNVTLPCVENTGYDGGSKCALLLTILCDFCLVLTKRIMDMCCAWEGQIPWSWDTTPAFKSPSKTSEMNSSNTSAIACKRLG